MFRNPAFSYSVSGRWISEKSDIVKYLKFFFIYIDLQQISSVFGSTTEPSELYGGRVYNPSSSLTQSHLGILYQREINLALTLTNHFFTEDLFTRNIAFLDHHHRKGNIIICTSDALAARIRHEFPLYTLRASIIKNLNTLAKIDKALKLYDDIVIPMDMNDDDDFLMRLPDKQRIMLFANAACAYSCPSRICYPEISKVNQSRSDTIRCKKQELGMLERAFYFFDVKKFREMGFNRFKLIPAKLFDPILKSKVP
jgi:hypothetical protein